MTDPPWPLWAPRRPLRRRRGGTFLPSLLSATLAALAFSVAPAAIAFSPPPSGSGPPLPRRQPNKPEPRPRSRPPSAASPDAVDAAYYGSPTAESSAFSSERLEAAARSSSSSAPAAAGGAGGGGGGGPARVTLTRWLSAKVQDYPELRDMESLHLSIQMACKTISNLIHSSTSDKLGGRSGGGGGGAGAGGGGGDLRDDSMKRLDQISKNVLQNALRFTGRLRVVEAPRSTGKEGEEGPAAHQPGVTIAYALDQYGRDGGGGGGGSRKQRGGGEDGDATARAESKWGTARRLAACFDPLDGSGNADAALCTGTVFGVFDADAGFKGGDTPDLRDASSLSRAVLQPGNKLLAAGYCLYSSTTVLVFTLGGGTHGFTLDPTLDEFVLTHPNMRIPKRGNIYSCNEAYSEGWDGKFKGYLRALKTGRGSTGQRYTQRYIGSMVGDVHRTLMYGGIFCCPSDSEVHHKGNLQLVYKSAPMAYILEHAGGKATDGKVDLLSVQPEYVHERSPCFMGSPDDMDELMAHLGTGGGDVAR